MLILLNVNCYALPLSCIFCARSCIILKGADANWLGLFAGSRRAGGGASVTQIAVALLVA